ncbi:MAG: hypothetical protein U1C70_13250 [Sediminibacterium sp.]|jgi:hypothetical protein|uniref:hypothetical protein n=1 Tax=Sediminibacterium sp. TaxID=1917865 RepID=UPI002AB9D749|nr:hypothetical protein [Sediminibacterium sp.]MDZ4072786.1 hypothetical protein [Sediminibacterium sp.]
MPNKSFEEQVREELSGLRIKPNDVVWQSVAASLQQKRRRRWAIWLLTLLIGLSSASFWLLIASKEETSKSLQSSQLKTKQGIIQNTEAAKINPSTKTSSPLPESLIPITNRTTHQKNNQADETVIPTDLLVSTKTTNKNELVSVSSQEIASSTLSMNANTEQADLPITHSKNDSVLIIPEIIGISETATIGLLQYDTIAVIAQETLTHSKKVSQWNWKAELLIGKSGIRNSLGSLFEGSSNAAYNNFIGSGLSTTASPGSGPINLIRPKVQDHFSFGTSVEMSKTIGKKKKNSLGIQVGYQLYQTKYRIGGINSGTLQFSNVNRSNESNVYYGVRDSVNYIASYHFIRLGLQWYRSLKWLKQTELRWYAGVGANLMVSSNGLHVGITNNNIYYFKNRSLLRNMQFDAVTGLEIGIGKQKRLFVGPQIHYMLSNVSKQNGFNQHLYRPSIKMSLLLSKSKK